MSARSSPLESIGMEIENIQSAVAGTRRIDDFLQQPERALPDLPRRRRRPQTARLPPSRWTVWTLRYRPGEPILKQFSWCVAPGENVTLAGAPAPARAPCSASSSASTAPQAGSVRVFGSDAARIRDADKRSPVRLCGAVLAPGPAASPTRSRWATRRCPLPRSRPQQSWWVWGRPSPGCR